MKLKLERPLIFMDIESTGLDTQKDKIIELSMVKLLLNGEKIIKTYRYNPEIKMSDDVIAIHGITNEALVDCPLFKQHAKCIISFLEGCDIAGYNSNYFDIPLLYSEIERAGFDWDYKKHCQIDVGNIFKINEKRDLTSAVRFYCNKEHEGAHSAENDAIATMDVFIAQLEKYKELPTNVDDLALYSSYGNVIVDLAGKFVVNEQKEIVFNFGKHKGQLAKNHLDFLSWMLAKGDFNKDTLKVVEYVMTNK